MPVWGIAIGLAVGGVIGFFWQRRQHLAAVARLQRRFEDLASKARQLVNVNDRIGARLAELDALATVKAGEARRLERALNEARGVISELRRSQAGVPRSKCARCGFTRPCGYPTRGRVASTTTTWPREGIAMTESLCTFEVTRGEFAALFRANELDRRNDWYYWCEARIHIVPDRVGGQDASVDQLREDLASAIAEAVERPQAPRTAAEDTGEYRMYFTVECIDGCSSGNGLKCETCGASTNRLRQHAGFGQPEQCDRCWEARDHSDEEQQMRDRIRSVLSDPTADDGQVPMPTLSGKQVDRLTARLLETLTTKG